MTANSKQEQLLCELHDITSKAVRFAERICDEETDPMARTEYLIGYPDRVLADLTTILGLAERLQKLEVQS